MKHLWFCLTLALTACQGWDDFVERNIIADDPYQYEQTSEADINWRIEGLEIKERWGALDKVEAKVLKALRKELAKRESCREMLK